MSLRNARALEDEERSAKEKFLAQLLGGNSHRRNFGAPKTTSTPTYSRRFSSSHSSRFSSGVSSAMGSPRDENFVQKNKTGKFSPQSHCTPVVNEKEIMKFNIVSRPNSTISNVSASLSQKSHDSAQYLQHTRINKSHDPHNTKLLSNRNNSGSDYDLVALQSENNTLRKRNSILLNENKALRKEKEVLDTYPRCKKLRTKYCKEVKGGPVGKGASGHVYRALKHDGSTIAIKFIKLKGLAKSAVEASKKEVATLQALRHPNIVAFISSQYEENRQRMKILMEYVSGQSLEQRYKEFGCFSEDIIRVYAFQILKALQYCHANNVIHRDLKGKNILVSDDGVVKLCDFGSAKFSPFVDVTQPKNMSICFKWTPNWAAPEVCQGLQYNSMVDIWSFGCVLIEMLTAKIPWAEAKIGDARAVQAHIASSKDVPRPPHEKLTSMSDPFRPLLLSCLQRDPAKRPEASALLDHKWFSPK